MKTITPCLFLFMMCIHSGCTSESTNSVRGDHLLVKGHFNENGDWVPTLRFVSIHDKNINPNAENVVSSTQLLLDEENLNVKTVSSATATGSGIHKEAVRGFAPAAIAGSAQVGASAVLRPPTFRSRETHNTSVNSGSASLSDAQGGNAWQDQGQEQGGLSATSNGGNDGHHGDDSGWR